MITLISRRLLRRMLPFPRIKLSVGRRNGARRNPENRVKSRHRIETTIEPEYVFVEVGLQMLRLDTAMMSSLDPSFQIAENKVDHRQVRLGLVWIAAERQRLMAISCLGKSRIGHPSIGANDGASRDILFDEACERFRAPIRHNTKSQSACIDATSALLAIIQPRPNLYRSDHDRLVVSAAPFPSRGAYPVDSGWSTCCV